MSNVPPIEQVTFTCDHMTTTVPAVFYFSETDTGVSIKVQALEKVIFEASKKIPIPRRFFALYHRMPVPFCFVGMDDDRDEPGPKFLEPGQTITVAARVLTLYMNRIPNKPPSPDQDPPQAQDAIEGA